MPADPKKIMIVEDSPTMCRMYRMVLGNLPGVSLVFANDGVEGLDLAAQETGVDLFIVDINMPRMDGIEFLRRLRRDLGVTEAPAVVISTEAGDIDRTAADDAGATDYLVKPWTPSQLLDLVSDVLNLEGQ